MEQVSGWSEQGGSVVTIPGTQGSGAQRFQQSFRGATVTVRDSSNNLATIYSDDLATPTAKANPFTASSTTGSWSFFTTTGTYSITFSGGSITAPFSITVNVGLGNAGGVPSYAYASLPTSKTQNAGDIARVTDTLRGLWMDTGTQWSKIIPEINVADFNASPSASAAVNTAAIQAALDAANTNSGAIIKFREGNYNINAALTGYSNVILQGMGRGVTSITQTTASAKVISWTDKSLFGASGITFIGTTGAHALHVIATAADVSYPIFRDVEINTWGSASAGLYFEVASTHPIYFPFLENVLFNGGPAAPSVSTRIGLRFGGAGSTQTVNPVIVGTRIYNCFTGVQFELVGTARIYNLAFDGIQDGSNTGTCLNFIDGTGSRLFGIRFESTSALDRYVVFGAGCSDVYVDGNFGAAGSSEITNNGTRCEWRGSDGSGAAGNTALFDQIINPTTITSPYTDLIREKTSASGVTVDSVLLKDGGAQYIRQVLDAVTAANAPNIDWGGYTVGTGPGGGGGDQDFNYPFTYAAVYLAIEFGSSTSNPTTKNATRISVFIETVSGTFVEYNIVDQKNTITTTSFTPSRSSNTVTVNFTISGGIGAETVGIRCNFMRIA